MNKTSRILAVLLLVVFAVGCSAKPTAINKPAAEKDAVMYNINGTCNIEKADGKVTVSGTTGLMNGAVVKISVFSEQGDELISKVTKVEGEAFSETFDVPADYTGTVYGFLSCTYDSNGSQPKEVVAAYGKKFVNLEGENVIWKTAEAMFVLMSEPIEL